MSDLEVKNNNGKLFDVKTCNLDDVRNSNDMQTLRKQFDNNERPESCRRCWAEEDAGRTSKRQNTIARIGSIVDDSNDLQFLDLKLGNICNLKCRICGSWSSSSIASEDAMAMDKPNRKGSFADTMLKKGAWPRKSETFWEELYDHSGEIRYLEFTGGEPFMIKEHFGYLEYLINLGVANDIEIHYNTNGTQWPDKYFHFWKQFKHVEIAFSIDNVGKRFEYERTGATWNEVNTNIENFIKLRDEQTNISLQLCTTINIFNVLYLKDIVAWDHFNKFDFVFWNMLHDSPEWCITSLPHDAKQAVAQKLKHSLILDENLQQEFNNIVDFMRHEPKVTLYELMIKIKCLDFKRGEHMKNTHPELWKLLAEAKFEKT